MYQKEIIYLSLFDKEIKEGCVGYLKSEKRQRTCQLELQVKNVPGVTAGSFPIRLQSETGWQEADMLGVKEGIGRWAGSIAAPLLRVEIILSDNRKIKGEGRKAPSAEKIDMTQEERIETKPEVKLRDDSSKPRQETKRQEEPVKPKQEAKFQEASSRLEQPAKLEEELPKPKQQIELQESPPNPRPIAKAEQIRVKPEHTPLYENKWEQLLSSYEQIHPYGDQRVYVKLEPKDFIVLRENYQHLVNNSFLLHGFYNYRYLILGKEKDFYVGVPGVFYEREKMVALMFGFEAFECEGGEAEEGKFGYYLRKVEI